MHKVLTIAIAALLLLMASVTPALAQDGAPRTAPEQGELSDLEQILQVLRPFIVDGRVVVVVHETRELPIAASEEQPAPWKTLALPTGEGADEGITCFPNQGCGCSNFNSKDSCDALKWSCGLIGGKYVTDQTEPYEIGSCYFPQ